MYGLVTQGVVFVMLASSILVIRVAIRKSERPGVRGGRSN